jgi:hypothetical protein
MKFITSGFSYKVALKSLRTNTFLNMNPNSQEIKPPLILIVV